MIDKQTNDLEESPGSLKPKYLLQKCPVCNGWGTVSYKRIVCHACGGKGYIAVHAEIYRKKYGEET